MKSAIIIHGTKGSPDGNWFQEVGKQLGDEGYDVFVPKFPTPEGQSLNNWLSVFDSLSLEMNKGTILIGHSVGAVFVLRLLERLERAIGVAVLVSAFSKTLGIKEYDILNSTFIEKPFDWRKIKLSVCNIICFSGSDDPYVPLEQGIQLAREISANHIIIENGGHLNAEFGFTSFPKIVNELKRIKLL